MKDRKKKAAEAEESNVGASAASTYKHTGAIDILGFGKDEKNTPWVALSLKTLDEQTRVVCLPADDIGPAFWRRLNRHGARVYSASAKTELLGRMHALEIGVEKFNVATQVGTHGGSFVMPDKIYASALDRTRELRNAVSTADPLTDRFKVAGTAKGMDRRDHTRRPCQHAHDLRFRHHACGADVVARRL